MNKYEWIEKRTIEIQRKVQSRADYCEEHGIPYYGSSECAWEEAEEEYNSIFGNEDDEDEGNN